MCAHTRAFVCALVCVLGGSVVASVLPQLMTETLVLIQGRNKELFKIIILNTLFIFSVETGPGSKVKLGDCPKQSYFA